VQNYGPELVDFAQRAAAHAVSPQLEALGQQNANLQQQLAVERRKRLDQQVTAAVPDYQQIDRNPSWHRWLLGIDPLNGKIRQQLLNDAISSGNSARVIAFFRGFQQQGHAPSATKSSRASSSRPTYTRDQIKQIYELHRKGAYAGREAEWARIKRDIFAAQREGRVQGAPYLTK
jgi:hypothetical protein